MNNQSKYNEFISAYSVKEPLVAKVTYRQKPQSEMFKKTDDGKYEMAEPTSINEANIVCAGQILYDSNLAEKAEFGDLYNFRTGFKLVKKCFDRADLSIGNFTSMAAGNYPPAEVMDNKYNQLENYNNARAEYLDALKYAGFNCFAMANPYNAQTGVDGIFSTTESLEKAGLLSSGIGTDRNILVNINKINIAVLSYTVQCCDMEKYITKEGIDAILNIYDPSKVKADAAEMRAKGAEFVLVYVNCGLKADALDENKRADLARETAEAGADYVVCTVSDEISKYFVHETTDGRKVPVATGLGTFMSGKPDEKQPYAALLNIVLYKLEGGKIEVKDSYIPLVRTDVYDKYPFAVLPTLKYFLPEDFDGEIPFKEGTKLLLGKEIHQFSKKRQKFGKTWIPQLTYQEVYDILGAKPSFMDRIRLKNMNAKAGSIGCRRGELKRGGVAVMMNLSNFYDRDKIEFSLAHAVKKGVSLVVDTKPCGVLPTIVVDNPKEAYIKLTTAIRNKYNPYVVAITGTSGKTTTKELMSAVFDTHYNTLHVDGNYNQFTSAGVILQKLTDKHEAYIQEVHGGTKNSAKTVSKQISPNICVITSIGEGHLKDMGTIENVIKGKMDIIAGMREDGVLIIDDDNQYLHEQHPDCKVIRYSRSNPECDYYAQNIQNFGEKILFQIVCEEGVYDAQLNFQGLHNINNALAVFAAGRYAGIPAYKIIAGLTHYIPDADKQNLTEAGGYKLLVDSYSSTAVSVESSIKGLSDFPVNPGEHRIAVVGDIPALGKKSVQVHKEVAQKIAKYNYDMLICYGEYANYFVEAAREAGKEAYYFEDREEFNRKIVESIHEGDIVLFKGGTRLHFKEETIYPLFGEIV